jgi:hypothetical protein
MLKTSPKLSFDVEKWLSCAASALMSPVEEGAWFRLRCYAWLDPDCSLPNDDSQLATLSRLGDVWQESGVVVRARFADRGGRLVDEELVELKRCAMASRAGCKRGGKASARTRQREREAGQMALLAQEREHARDVSEFGETAI